MSAALRNADWIDETVSALPPLARIGEVCELLRIDERTARRLVASGTLRAVKARETGSARLLFPRAEVARYLSALTPARTPKAVGA